MALLKPTSVHVSPHRKWKAAVSQAYHHQLVVLRDRQMVGSVWPVGCLALMKETTGCPRMRQVRVGRSQRGTLVYYQAEGTAGVAITVNCMEGKEVLWEL